MNLLPYENITYKTALTPEQIVEKIQNVIEPKKTFRMTGIFSSKDHRPYEGEVDHNSFDIRRIIGYRNSFLPIIKGQIEQDINGTTIIVKMRVHYFVTVFMLVWYGSLGSAFLGIFFSALFDGSFEYIGLFPLAMFFFGYLMTIVGFKSESEKSKKFLAKVFDSEIDGQNN